MNFDGNVVASLRIGPDRYLWDLTEMRKISTRQIWESTRFFALYLQWPRFIWTELKLNCYAFLEWIVCHGRLPTKVRLRKFGCLSEVQYPFCIAGVESTDHLLLLCIYSESVLRRIFLVLAKDLNCPFHS